MTEASVSASRQKRRELAVEHMREIEPVIRERQAYGCDTIQKLRIGLEKRGMNTATGNRHWSFNAVKNILARLEKKPHSGGADAYMSDAKKRRTKKQ